MLTSKPTQTRIVPDQPRTESDKEPVIRQYPYAHPGECLITCFASRYDGETGEREGEWHLLQPRVKWLILANLKERRFDESTVHSHFSQSLLLEECYRYIVTFRVELPIKQLSSVPSGYNLKGHPCSERPLECG
jgi:hypothetical protein